MRVADATGFVLHAEAAKRLRLEFAEKESALLKARVSAVIKRWHEGLPAELLRMETLTWMGLGMSGPPSDADGALRFAARLEATALRGERDPRMARALRSYGSKSLPSLPSQGGRHHGNVCAPG